MKRCFWMAQRISLNLLAVCLTIFFLFAGVASAQTANDSTNQSGTPSLGDVLEPDGTIKKGVVGGFSAAGFEMKLDANGAPRFVPAGTNDKDKLKAENPALDSRTTTIGKICGNFDRRFYNSGAYDDSFYNFPVIAAVATDGKGNLFIGGRFAYMDNVVSYNIARYDITTDTWSALGGGGLKSDFGPYNFVNALAISGDDLFVGGRFKQTQDGTTTNLRNIARYNLATNTWSALPGNGLKYQNYSDGGDVRALAIFGNDLIVGGDFDRTADGTTQTNIHRIARFNFLNNTWSPLAGGGLSDQNGAFGTASVHALAISGNDLFVGGNFKQSTDGTTINLNNIARYQLAGVNANTWSSLTGNGLFGSYVYALLISGNELFVGGSFSRTHNGAITNLNNIARYNFAINNWTPLDGTGLNSNVLSFAVSGNQLIVGGEFSQTFNGATTNLNNVARYDLTANAWSPLTGNGLNFNRVHALLTVGSDLFVGGYFKQTFDGSTKNLNSVALYKILTNVWYFMGSNNGIGLNSTIKAVAVDTSGNIYVGGLFAQTASGVMTHLNSIARYSYSANSWGGLAGFGLNNAVNALAINGNDLYVGGSFTATADGTTMTNLNRIARYDIMNDVWFPLTENGLNNEVTTLLISGGNLFVGGFFSQTFNATTTNLNRIARYNLTFPNPAPWSGFANNGLNAPVRALVISGSGNELFVGGEFTQTQDGVITSLKNIARYGLTGINANTWSPLIGSGLNAPVNALAVSGNELFVGGEFTRTFNSATPTLNRIARYDFVSNPNTWTALSENGLNNAVYALAVNGNKLFVGGSFTATATASQPITTRVAGYNTTTNMWSRPAFFSNDPFLNNFIDVNNDVLALTLSGNDLIVGGVFTEVAKCGVASFLTRHYLKKWSPTLFAKELGGTDWHDGSNWSDGTAPAANTNVSIPDGDVSITSADVVMNDLILDGGTLTIGMGRTLTINGILNLGGIINGAGTVVIANCKPDGIIGGESTAYIQTALVRCVNDTGTFNFPVGTPNGYSPITVKNITGTGNISIKANEGAYSNPATGLPGNRLARWWQIENPGGGITNANLHFGYLQSDIAGNEGIYKAYRISGGTASLMVSSVNTFSNMVTAPNVTGFSDWTLGELSPTSVSVSVGGRVSTLNGIGISKVFVLLTNGNGITRAALTNAFGYYRIDDVTVGETYVISAQSKRYQFANNPQVLTVMDEISDLHFMAQP